MKIKSITLSLAALALASCSQTELIESGASMQGMIDYSLYAGRNTRATALDNTNFKKFKIYSYQNIEEVANPGNFTFSAYYDETVEKATTWAGPRPRRWPTAANDFLNFYAYSDEDNVTGYVGATAVDAHPTFVYTVPADATKQQDLLVATAFNQQEKTAQGKLNIDFKHALTQVAFKVKSASPIFEVKVAKVELIQANSSATFGYDATAQVGAWSAAGTPLDYTFTVETPAKVDDADFVELAAADGNLMMIPNADPKAVKVRVTYTLDDDDPADLTKLLVKEVLLEKESATAGPNQPAVVTVTPWAMGKKVTYNLTLPGRANEIIFGDATMTEDWDVAEENNNVNVVDPFNVKALTVSSDYDFVGKEIKVFNNTIQASGYTLKVLEEGTNTAVSWLSLSESPNDMANAKSTVAYAADGTVTRADYTTEKAWYVYTTSNNTQATRKARIVLERAGLKTEEIVITQPVEKTWFAMKRKDGKSISFANASLVLKNGKVQVSDNPKSAGLHFLWGTLVGWNSIMDNTGILPFDINNMANADKTPIVSVLPTEYTGALSVGAAYDNTNLTYADGTVNFTQDATKGLGDPCTYYLGAKYRYPTTEEISELVGYSGALEFTVFPLSTCSNLLSPWNGNEITITKGGNNLKLSVGDGGLGSSGVFVKTESNAIFMFTQTNKTTMKSGVTSLSTIGFTPIVGLNTPSYSVRCVRENF